MCKCDVESKKVLEKPELGKSEIYTYTVANDTSIKTVAFVGIGAVSREPI